VQTSASCDKDGSLVDDLGPGNDWRCVVTWHIPCATATDSAVYQFDVTPDRRYVADGDDHSESTASSRSIPLRVTRQIPFAVRRLRLAVNPDIEC